MKCKKSIFAVSLMLLSATAANAQATYTDADGNKYEFKKHAYLQLQGGAQYTLGESSFGDLISPNVQLGIGYQFCPWFGARIAANAWQSKGGFNGHGVTEAPGTDPGNTTYKYNYVAPGIDFMFNLSNAICGYNPLRVVNVSAFVGGAANIAWGNDEANDMVNKRGFLMSYIWDGTKVRPVGRAGLAIDFRLSDAVSLGLEGNVNVMTDKYNSKKADNADWYFNALAGLKINLGKTYKKTPKPAPEPEPVVEPVVEKKPEPKPEPVVVKKDTIRRDVFFKINSFRIDEANEKKIAELADFMNAHSDAKLTVTGYADAGTGTDAINDRISKKRADAVVSLLVNRYKVDASRIISDSKGARVQPYAENDKNRVSICISEGE